MIHLALPENYWANLRHCVYRTASAELRSRSHSVGCRLHVSSWGLSCHTAWTQLKARVDEKG